MLELSTMINEILAPSPNSWSISENEKEKIFKFHDLNLHQLCLNGELKLIQNGLTILKGKNGVGKTTLLNFIFHNQRQLLNHKNRISFCGSHLLAPTMATDVESLIKGFIHFHFAHFDTKDQLALQQKIIDSLLCFDFKSQMFGQSINKLSSGQNKILKNILFSYFPADIYFWDEPFEYLDLVNRLNLFHFYHSHFRNKNYFNLLVSHLLDELLLKEMTDHLIFYEIVDRGMKNSKHMIELNPMINERP
jgi:lincosamide and streptogramin A transport system ATP-binding/permease protein